MGHVITVGLPIFMVRRQNKTDRSEPPKAIKVRDEQIQGVTSSWHIWDPSKGTRHPQASYLSLSPDREVSFTPLHVVWHRAVRVFRYDYPEKTRETTWPEFCLGGGALAPV
jgi:hypothetical protein